ncbi:MAG TPA: hypothetical protein PKG81_05555, partial [Candidatus Omnitrophota bacterium]|nr:hypothetical protein [Candidatus Omnitrophota bacterium]
MFKVIKSCIKQGRRTLKFPKGKAPVLPARYRGRPIVAGENNVAIDMGKITFAPDAGIIYSNDFSMAVSKREDLVLKEGEKVGVILKKEIY